MGYRFAQSLTAANTYYYCVAISNTDDLTSSTLAWYTYQFALNPVLGVNTKGDAYWPDWPKFGTWWDAYYVAVDFHDVNNGVQEDGVVACALDRTNMLTGGTACLCSASATEPNPDEWRRLPEAQPDSGGYRRYDSAARGTARYLSAFRIRLSTERPLPRLDELMGLPRGLGEPDQLHLHDGL